MKLTDGKSTLKANRFAWNWSKAIFYRRTITHRRTNLLSDLGYPFIKKGSTLNPLVLDILLIEMLYLV